jgi:choline dehydrogenase-like flavoprotein
VSSPSEHVNDSWDAIVVGSGASGGVAAMTLAEGGARVLVLEAGPDLSRAVAFGTPVGNMLRRLAGISSGRHRRQAQHPGYWKANPELYADERRHPYEHPVERPFLWTRGWQVGGRSLTWGGITLRLSDEDFAGIRSKEGVIRWPIGFADLEQHYSDLERQLGVFGARDGLAQLPDGVMSDALPSTDAELRFAEAVRERLGHAVIQSRGFAPHAPQRTDDWPASSSRGSTLQRAIATGRVEVMADQMVERLCLSADASTATAVVAVDQTNGERRTLSADLVILCASTIQTLSILLRTRQFSSGGAVVDPSGRLGTRLMDHVSTSQFFAMPGSGERPQPPLSGAGSFFLPFGRHLSQASFQGGYGLWGGIGRFDPPTWLQRRPGTVTGFLIGHGEVEPRPENRVTLSDTTDRWGVTVPHIDCRWGESERAMVTHMQRTMAECIEAAEGQALEIRELFHLPFVEPLLGGAVALSKQAAPPGYYIHEVGGAAMGKQASESVVDPDNRLWGCRNVLVVDGACWPTSAWQSPTLTMMAIARRACSRALSYRGG